MSDVPEGYTEEEWAPFDAVYEWLNQQVEYFAEEVKRPPNTTEFNAVMDDLQSKFDEQQCMYGIYLMLASTVQHNIMLARYMDAFSLITMNQPGAKDVKDVKVGGYL